MKKLAWIIFGSLCVLISFYPLKYLLADKPIALLLSKSVELLSSNIYNTFFYTHIMLGGIALLIGWLQFSEKLRRNYIKLHRTIGKIYVASVLISGPAGFYIALFASGGFSPKLGFSIGALLWTIFTYLGYSSIRKGNIETHRKFMMYSYAGTFGAVTLRLWLPLLILAFGEFLMAYQIVAWLSWIPNMIMVYIILNKRDVLTSIYKTYRIKIILAFFLISFNLTYSQSASEFSKETEQKITDYINNTKKYYNSPNIAIAITDSKNTIYLKEFGESKTNNKYLIGSCSKSFTGLLIALLEEKKLLNTNDYVTKHLDWFSYKDKAISNQIRIKDLLYHISGITTEMGRQIGRIRNNNLEYDKLIDSKLNKFCPNLSEAFPFQYSNLNYQLLGLIIEKATQKSYSENLNEYILKPLNLNQTSIFDAEKLIESYQYLGAHPIINVKETVHKKQIPSGYIMSTANDMSIYLRQLMNAYNSSSNSIINKDITNAVFTKNPNNNSNYSFGWDVIGTHLIAHGGTNRSFSTKMMILPEAEKAIIVMVNSHPAPASEIADGIYNILQGFDYLPESSIKLHRYLPYATLGVLLIFIFQFNIWRKKKYIIKLNKSKIINSLFLLFLFLIITSFLLIPYLYKASLLTMLDYDLSSGLSLIVFYFLLLLISTLLYFNKSENNLQNVPQHTKIK